MTETVERVADAARASGTRVAVAESLTCGLLASAVGRGTAAEEWFAGGVVAYQTRTKERVLGVSPGLDPVSAECAEQLATGVRELLDADVAVSTTGVGGPGADDGHPAGTVFIGWATRSSAGHLELSLDGGPEEVLAATVDEAMDVLDSLLARVAAG
jgi:nicotinamide-nucleotide amidase